MNICLLSSGFSLFHPLHKLKEIYPDSVVANRQGRLFFASLTILLVTGTIPSLHSELKFRLVCTATAPLLRYADASTQALTALTWHMILSANQCSALLDKSSCSTVITLPL